jgi:putative phosphoribosyl transferase
MTGVQLPLENRSQAGRALAERLCRYNEAAGVLVLALPRGGVPVAWEIAEALGAPLDVLVVRKLGAPGWPELAAGAIASGGIRVLNRDVIEDLRITEEALEHVAAEEYRELERRERVYRGDRQRVPIAGRTVILVDDGVATGATIRAGIAALRQQDPERIVVAVPVAPPDTLELLRSEADEVVCLAAPVMFRAIGEWYRDFRQVSDDEVCELLADGRAEASA